MDLAERKARILYGQHLTNLADQKLVCRDLNGIQASSCLPPSTLWISARRAQWSRTSW